MEALIVHCNTIFDEQIHTASYASSPPLPPAPLGETAPPYAYGSTHTKFSEYALQQSNAPLPQTPTPQSTGDDFTPKVPPRPPASIHPSSRGNTGSSNGHSNTSPILTEAEANVETNVSSPTSYIAVPPLPLRPGRQGAQTPVQSLIGTKGLDFSQPEVSEGDWTGPAPASPPLSGPPSPLPTPSALPGSTFAHQQQQAALTHILTQEQPQAKAQPPPSLPAVERTTVGKPESINTPFETPLNATEDDGHSTNHAGPIVLDAATGPTLQLVTSRPLTQQVPQVPVQTMESQERSKSPQSQSLRQPEEAPQGRHESQDEIPPSLLQ